jgi:hypothetical protein
MPERLYRVSIALGSRRVHISWEARDALLARLQRVGTIGTVRVAFTAVGATRTVSLTPPERATLLDALENWALEADKFEAISAELRALRDAVIADLHHAE